jgi:hypothetical protein
MASPLQTAPTLGPVDFRRSFGGTIARKRRLSFGPTLRLALLLVLMVSGSVRAQESTQDPAAGRRAQQSTQELAAAAQNPVAAMYSLPFQDTIYGGAGPNHDATANVLNIQPVIPITVGDWNIISRTIAPLIYLPSLTTGPSEITEQSLFSGSHFGLGDINQSFYFSPAKPTELIWGIGPSFNLPTATATPLGSAKFSMGPAAVALAMPKPWVIGALARELWSVKGPSNRPDVSQLLLEPFVNYNMEEGWYLVSSPIITANWLAPSNKWALPIGAGIGKIFRIGDQPMNASLQAFDYVLSPTGGPKWAVRAQLQFLFPR